LSGQSYEQGASAVLRGTYQLQRNSQTFNTIEEIRGFHDENKEQGETGREWGRCIMGSSFQWSMPTPRQRGKKHSHGLHAQQAGSLLLCVGYCTVTKRYAKVMQESYSIRDIYGTLESNERIVRRIVWIV
jgi:hypothetical protein